MPHHIASNIVTEMLNIVPANSTILELGTGSGTASLAKYFDVISIEHDVKWHTDHSKLIDTPLVNLNKLNVPNAFRKRFAKASEWYDPEVIEEALVDVNYKAILVDGPNGGARRAGLWWFYRHLFDTSVPVIVDDVHRQYDWLVAAEIARTKGVASFQVHRAQGDKSGNNMFAVIV